MNKFVGLKQGAVIFSHDGHKRVTMKSLFAGMWRRVLWGKFNSFSRNELNRSLVLEIISGKTQDYCLFYVAFDHENRGNASIQKVDKYLPDYTESHSKPQYFSLFVIYLKTLSVSLAWIDKIGE
jgi:hypothetical protein